MIGLYIIFAGKIVYTKKSFRAIFKALHIFSIKEKECQKEWHIYYLTLTGYKPSESSIGDNKECNESLKLISWEQSIYQWIIKLLDETEIKKLPNIREVLSQFGDSI